MLAAINSVASAAGASTAGASGAAATGMKTGAPAAPFADLMADAAGQVKQLDQQAESAVTGLMTGSGVDVHQAMIATEKAEMGFDMVVAVREKALAAYQQVMSMQF